MRKMGVYGTVLTLGVVTACSSDATTVPQEARDARSVASAPVTAKQDGEDHNRKIAIRDNCDPTDPAWAPTGGCLLKRGDVTNAEFGAFLRSPLTVPANGALIGHPSWRNEPSYLSIESGKSLRVANEGGRTHTFTEVAQFGGGRVPPLNIGLTPAPECAAAQNLAPGAAAELSLSDGLHRFECCIHPWMRAVVRVSPDND